MAINTDPQIPYDAGRRTGGGIWTALVAVVVAILVVWLVSAYSSRNVATSDTNAGPSLKQSVQSDPTPATVAPAAPTTPATTPPSQP